MKPPESKTLRCTVNAVFSTRDLAASVESVAIWTWTRHHAHAYVRYVRPILDDETVRWTRWAKALKHEIDPESRLAVTP